MEPRQDSATSVETNLGLAKRAVEYVKNKLRHGSSNNIEDTKLRFTPKGGCGFLIEGIVEEIYTWGCVKVLQRNLISDMDQNPSAYTNQIQATRLVAAKASQYGCGNCGEQASVAFVYLLDAGVRPLDFMKVVNGDHAFVVIGRAKDSQPADPKTWGSASVVCDPWNNIVYATIPTFVRLLQDGTQVASELRLD